MNSYPADEATKIITACSEVIFEMDSANHLDVRVDRYPATSGPSGADAATDEVGDRTLCASDKRRWLSRWFQKRRG